jgi:hypothetical protein
MKSNNTNKQRIKRVSIVLCIIAYAILMGLRSEFDEHWVKNLIAGCAGGFLGCALALSQIKK